MQYVCEYLYRKGKVPNNSRDAFIAVLNQAWFELYARGRSQIKDSSGFEHVFIGEVCGCFFCLSFYFMMFWHFSDQR